MKIEENRSNRTRGSLDILGYLESAGLGVILNTLGAVYLLFCSELLHPSVRSEVQEQRIEERYHQSSNQQSEPVIYYKSFRLTK